MGGVGRAESVTLVVVTEKPDWKLGRKTGELPGSYTGMTAIAHFEFIAGDLNGRRTSHINPAHPAQRTVDIRSHGSRRKLWCRIAEG
jgi:hypothetical protein